MATVMTIKSSEHLSRQLESDSNKMGIKQEIVDHEYIHSGHFMLSRVHDPSPEDDEDDDSSSQSADKPVPYDFTNSKKEPSASYEFRPQNFDSSLAKLFECLSLAYR